jgi:hypothetical protein
MDWLNLGGKGERLLHRAAAAGGLDVAAWHEFMGEARASFRRLVTVGDQVDTVAKQLNTLATGARDSWVDREQFEREMMMNSSNLLAALRQVHEVQGALRGDIELLRADVRALREQQGIAAWGDVGPAAPREPAKARRRA